MTILCLMDAQVPYPSATHDDVLLNWLLEEAPFGVAFTRGDGTVWLNEEAARIAMLSERSYSMDAFARNVVLIDAAGVRLETGRPLSRAIGGERVPRERMQVARADGTRVDVCVEAFPVLLRGAHAAVVLVQDVTWTLQDERRQSEWLGALGHELNGAIQHFLSSSQAAQLYLLREPARARHHLEHAEQQAKLLRRMVRDFVDASRLEAGFFSSHDEPIDVGALLADLAETAEMEDARHRVIVEAPDGLWVHADADRVRQILSNLFSNAAKYATPGLLTLGARADGARVIISLRDEGPGIPAGEQSRLFHRYHRLPSRSEGSGLGLWIAREHALRMGGELWLESRDGEWSTFHLALPAGRGVLYDGEQPAERP